MAGMRKSGKVYETENTLSCAMRAIDRLDVSWWYFNAEEGIREYDKRSQVLPTKRVKEWSSCNNKWDTSWQRQPHQLGRRYPQVPHLPMPVVLFSLTKQRSKPPEMIAISDIKTPVSHRQSWTMWLGCHCYQSNAARQRKTKIFLYATQVATSQQPLSSLSMKKNSCTSLTYVSWKIKLQGLCLQARIHLIAWKRK